MNFLNTYSLDAIYKHLYIKGLAKIRPEYASLDPKSVTREYLEKQIREILPVDQAEIIIQGTVEYIRDSGLNRLLSSFSGRSIFTMEKPIERRFVNDALSFTQTDISFNDMDEDDINAFKSGKTFDEVSTRKFLLQSNVALQSNPALMYVSEVKREEYEKYLEVILQGIPTLATNHAGSIWQNLERIMAVQEDEKSAKQSIIGGMGGMINFRRYAADDESFLFSYEYLIMTDDILTRFRNTSVKEFEKVITVSMMPKEYIRHEYSLIRQIYTRFLKTGASVGIKTYGMPEYSDLMSDFNIEKVSKFY